MSAITSRDNPRLRRWRDLVRDAAERRKEKCAIVEGAHLVAACIDSRTEIKSLILSKTGSARSELALLGKRSGKIPVILSDSLFRQISDTQAPAGIVAEITIPQGTQNLETAPACVFLEGIQDAGNVGAILRSAAAFGIQDAALGPGCADAWSPKVLRAAMGAHFSMRIAESADLAVDIGLFGGTVVCTVPRDGVAISAADLSGRIGWIFGTEGQGVSDALAARATLKVSIPMSGSAESLNVAAAAAICFYQSSLAGGGA